MQGGQAAPGRQSRAHARLGRLKAELRQAVRWISPASDPAYAAEVQDEQNRLLTRTSYLFAMSGSSSVFIVALDFHRKLGTVGILLCVAIPALYGTLVILARQWMQGRGRTGFHRQSLICLGLLGIFWGALLVLLSGERDISQQRMVAALLIGLVSTPVMTAPFSAALVFWVPSAASAVIALCGRQDPFDIYLLMGTLGYLGLTFVGMVLLNRSLLERSISRVRLSQQNLTISLFLRDYEENASDWLWQTDASLRICHVSPRFAQASWRPATALSGTVLPDMFCPATPSDATQTFRDLLNQRAAFRDLVLPIDNMGECHWWSMTGRPHFDAHAQFQGYHGIGSDRTDVERAETRIRYMATHDSLTGLANRQRLLDTLQAACDRQNAVPSGAPESPDGQCCLMLLDLDRFKAVNDGFGHAAGDALLVAVAVRLRELAGDTALVARLGGDEFAIMMPAGGQHIGAALAAGIITRLSKSYLLPEARVSIGASIGMALLPQDGTDTVSLLRSADLALYVAKSQGRGRWQWFQPYMQIGGTGQPALHAELRDAIETGALFLEFQPIVHLPSGQAVSVEALLRWRHPTRGVIPPMEFIPLAEDAGLIAQIGLVVLREACRAAASWPAGVRLAVNVSPHQLRNRGLLEMMDAILDETGFAASRLELEITETAMLDATPQILAMLEALGKRGIRIVLDDFGTGHSSLNHLREFRLDGLKLSSDFIHGLEHDQRTAAIVAAVAFLAGRLDIPVTAEGVETDSQLVLVQAQGITRVQGFLFSRPLDAAGIGSLLWSHGKLAGLQTSEANDLGINVPTRDVQ